MSARSAAPRLLDPALAMVERLDRWRRRIRPVAAGSLLGLELRRYRGRAVTLGDGTTVEGGSRIGVIHLNNRRLRQLGRREWQTEALARAREDLDALAAWAEGQPPGRRPTAYLGVTLLAAFARRFGFELQPRTRTVWHRLEDWYLRGLLARWSPDGRRRLSRGHSELRAGSVWLSDRALRKRLADRDRQ